MGEQSSHQAVQSYIKIHVPNFENNPLSLLGLNNFDLHDKKTTIFLETRARPSCGGMRLIVGVG